ncbi:MAG TPA: hypothetical protein ENO28_12225 [Bacteroidetes bacterium]|nr:hypothetical protein [Bacteroidota bacterium]
MKFNKDIEAFIKDFVKDLRENNAAVFAGAGMSRPSGFVNWSELLSDIADELGLDIDKEWDLISLAQYHVNESRGKAKINRKILEEFSEQAEPSINHKIIARLPLSTFWTTNYDTLIEDALREAGKIVDVKYEVDQLVTTRPKRDGTVYKMHGDVNHPSKAIITKEQYQAYYKTHEPFVSALSGDLITKTFLFIGFSFTDPNLDYVLSRLSTQFGQNTREHYCFIKKETKAKNDDDDIFRYKQRKQELMINDLKRYHIKALVVEDYTDITNVLQEIEMRYKKNTVFISGSAEEYGEWGRETAQNFIHSLAKKIVSSGYNVVNGFGWGVGSAVINGALEAIYNKPQKSSFDQLILRPFPQFKTGKKELSELWEEYRQNMISLSGIAIILFGNKKNDNGQIVNAKGVVREFEIAIEQKAIPIPIGKTGFAAKEIYDTVAKKFEDYYSSTPWIIPFIEEINDKNYEQDRIIETLIKIIHTINKQ